MIRAVLWDIDGTLIDSEPAHHAALVTVSARYGASVAKDDSRFVGMAMEQVFDVLAAHFPAGLSRQSWIDEIAEAYVGSSPRLQPLPGAREAVLALKRAGTAQACVSNSVRRIVEANLATLALGDAIAFALAREDVLRGKPDPEPYALACQRLDVAPSQAIAVEDSDVGAASASAAGLRVFRVDPDGEVFATVVALAAVDVRQAANERLWRRPGRNSD